MKKLPLDVSTLRTLILEDYLYIDKTRIIYEHILQGRYFFLSRPRRFGKTLLISTLKEIYAGNKELFKDLWIDSSSDYTWPKHPVISLNFAKLDIESPDALKLSLGRILDKIAAKYKIDLSKDPTPGLKLDTLVETLAEEHKVVVLIDEYDAPIVKNLTNGSVAEENRKVLSNFFNVLKSLDSHLRAIVITGVSNFSKTSLFSGLNNLVDLSLKPIAADLLGCTEEEIAQYLTPYVDGLVKEKQLSYKEIMKKMRNWYNGYQFSKRPVKVYNPFSVLYLLKKKEFNNYWFESSTPSFLINKIAQDYSSYSYHLLETIEQARLTSRSLGTFEVDAFPLIPLLFQTGYLTIKDYDKETATYQLGYPNYEVEESLTVYLFASFAHSDVPTVEQLAPKLRDALRENDVDTFCETLKTLFAHIPYQIQIPQERYYHSLFQLLGTLLGFETQSEVSTDKGRIDVVFSTKKHVYIFEIKYDADAQTALKQIKERAYFERYLATGKPIMLIGLSFNPGQGKLEFDCTFEALSS